MRQREAPYPWNQPKSQAVQGSCEQFCSVGLRPGPSFLGEVSLSSANSPGSYLYPSTYGVVIFSLCVCLL